MEDREANAERWVDDRLGALEAPEWEPDAGAGLARLYTFDRAMKRRSRRRLLVTVLSAAVLLAAMLMEAPKAYCAGAGCAAPAHEKPPRPPARPPYSTR